MFEQRITDPKIFESLLDQTLATAWAPRYGYNNLEASTVTRCIVSFVHQDDNLPAMPVINFPYKRPFYNLTLTPQEINEDISHVISHTKRKRKTSPTQNGS